MKVLHAAETIKGGVATVMRQLVVHQASLANVRALVPQNQMKELHGVAPSQIATFQRSGRGLGSLMHFAVAFAAQVFSFKPDVVHLHSTFAGAIGRVVLLLLWPVRRPRVVYCPHAFSFLMQGSASRRKAFALIEKSLYPFTHAIVCVSRYEKDQAIAHGLPAARLHVVYNGVPVPAGAVSASPYTGQGPHILFIGRFDFQKGFDIILDAMRRLEDTSLHLTAVGAPVHAEDTPPVRPNITYPGWLTPQQLAPYLAHANVLVMPSRWEGFAMVPLEAMSHGVPVIATNCTSLPEVVHPDETGMLFPLGDSSSLAGILRTTHAGKWKTMGEAARRLHRTSFTSDTMLMDTWKLYQADANTR